MGELTVGTFSVCTLAFQGMGGLGPAEEITLQKSSHKACVILSDCRRREGMGQMGSQQRRAPCTAAVKLAEMLPTPRVSTEQG